MSQLRQPALILLVLGLSLVQAAATGADAPAATDLAALHAAGRTGAGMRVVILGDGSGLDALVHAVAPAAGVARVPASDEAAALAALSHVLADPPHVLLVDMGFRDGARDGSSPLSRALADAAATPVAPVIVVPTGDDALAHWRGAWRDVDGDRLLDTPMRVRIEPDAPLVARLSWSGGGADDYDLYLWDADGKEPLAWSVAHGNVSETLSFAPASARDALLQVRAHRTTGPATLRVSVENATLGDVAIRAGSLLRPSDARGVVAVGAATDASGEGPTDDGRAAPLLRGAPGARTSREAAAHAAGAFALLRAERPDLAASALPPLLAPRWPDVAHAVAALDTTPATLHRIDADLAPALRPGAPVAVVLRYDDALASTVGNATARLVLADGGVAPLALDRADARSWRASGTVPEAAADGALRLEVQGVRDWAGHAVDDARVPLGIVDGTAPAVAWASIPRHAAGPFTVSWSATDAGAGVARTRVEARVAEGDWSVLHESGAASGAALWPASQEGAVRFRAFVADAAGNVVTLDAPSSTLVDLTPPTLNVVGGTEATRDRRASIVALVTDEGSGLAAGGVALFVDGASVPFALDPEGRFVHEPTFDRDVRAHAIELVARDVAGHETRRAWTLDILPPPLDEIYAGFERAADGPAPSATRSAPTYPPPVRTHVDRLGEVTLPRAPPPATTPPVREHEPAGPLPGVGLDIGEGATLLEPSAVRTADPDALAPEYDWQPPMMVIFFAVVAAILLYVFRRRVAAKFRAARILADHAWARVLRLRFFFIDAKGLPQRARVRIAAWAHRARWRAARIMERARPPG